MSKHFISRTWYRGSMPVVMSLPTLSMSGAELMLHMSLSALTPPCSLKYAAVESARTDDDASYRVRSQVEAE